MNWNSIRWRLPASYVLIALLAALSLGSMMLLVLCGYYSDQEREYLEGNATALRPVIEQILQSKLPKDSLQDQINGLSFLSQTQIRLLDMNGNTLADSGVPQINRMVGVSGGEPMAGSIMFNLPVNPPAENVPLLIYKSDESFPVPETIPFEKNVIPGKTGDIILSVNASPYGYGFVARAKSDPMPRSPHIVSIALRTADGMKLGALEFSHGPSYGADVIDSVTLAWLIASIFAMGIAAGAGWLISRQMTRPVLALEHATQQMEQGKLGVRVDLQKERQQEYISLANSFNGMAEQVEQTISTLRAFVADAAHELHTPLSALQANLELARDEENASERTRYLERAQEQGQRLGALVQSLLDLSRIESAESLSDFEAVELVSLVRELGEQFASRAEQTERIFKMNLPEETIHIHGREAQLRQVINNLLENALKFTPPGGTIGLGLVREDGDVVLTVTDSGIGIPAEDLPLLFKRFHRARNASTYPGSGLGLAIVEAIVRVHRGRIDIVSQEGQGTVVTVRAGSRQPNTSSAPHHFL